MHPFSTLSLSHTMADNLASLGYVQMTPVQQDALPAVLQNRDVVVRARTGSGKTLAFGIGLVTKLNPDSKAVQGLVLCPTRELAEQVAEQLRKLARHLRDIKILTLCGGVPLAPQRDSLARGAHIVVGTPGRILDHLGKVTLMLSDVHSFVLDEADRMLDMGFAADIRAIADRLTAPHQVQLYSATYPEGIAEIASGLMHEPVFIDTDTTPAVPLLEQHFYSVKGEKSETLFRLLGRYGPSSAVIFCNTKLECDALAMTMQNTGYRIGVLHGGFTQEMRTDILTRFTIGAIRLLIATDVAARGLDIKSVGAVINYDLPEKPETYLHRIGRTARAGSTGIALSLFTPKQQPRAERLAESAHALFSVRDASDFGAASPEMLRPRFNALRIEGGRKEKLRPGDLLGAVCASGQITRDHVGEIVILEKVAYIAVASGMAAEALRQLQSGKIKGRKFRVQLSADA